jgi:hypothetical protein
VVAIWKVGLPGTGSGSIEKRWIRDIYDYDQSDKGNSMGYVSNKGVEKGVRDQKKGL